ncbi:hypothetical protein CR513_50032, partial [Mucuna pruriens]
MDEMNTPIANGSKELVRLPLIKKYMLPVVEFTRLSWSWIHSSLWLKLPRYILFYAKMSFVYSWPWLSPVLGPLIILILRILVFMFTLVCKLHHSLYHLKQYNVPNPNCIGPLLGFSNRPPSSAKHSS